MEDNMEEQHKDACGEIMGIQKGATEKESL